MSIIDAIRKLGWSLPSHSELLEEREFDPHTGKGTFHLYKTSACNFEVLDGGTWYKVDAKHPFPELYDCVGIPDSIVTRVYTALEPVYGKVSWREDPTQIYLEALRREFDDVRFVNMTIVPGAIY